MKHTLLSIAFLNGFIALPLLANPTALPFLESSFWSAKIKAEKEDKSYMIIYGATNCPPCEWMDNQTFAAPQVTAFIGQHLVAAKVDIHTPNGKEQKRQYYLTKIPTVIIFDKNGQEKGRLDEPVVTRGMMDFMKQHVAFKPTNSPITDSQPDNYENESVQPLVPQNAPSSPPSPTIAPPVRTNYAASSSGTFSVQIGAFGTKESAFEVMGRLNDTYATAATIYPGFTNGKNWYKVSIGVFHDKQKAEEFKIKMRGEGFSDAFVKVW